VIQEQLKHTVEALWKFEIPVKQKLTVEINMEEK